MYQFSLEPVLQHRITVEEKLQKELADIQYQQMQMREQEQCMEERRQRLFEDMRRKQMEGLTVSESLTYSDFCSVMNVEIELLKIQLRQLDKKVHDKRKELLEAVKNRKILDKLKERQTLVYQTMLQKQEQDFIDEMATNAFYRNRG